MKPASLQRIENMRRVVDALAERSMGPRAVAELLAISERAARVYLKELEEANVVEPDPGWRTALRLHADPTVVPRFFSALEGRSRQHRIALRRSGSRHCTHPGKEFLHVLADDTRFPLVLHEHPVRRDPLVAALFGAVRRWPAGD